MTQSHLSEDLLSHDFAWSLTGQLRGCQAGSTRVRSSQRVLRWAHVRLTVEFSFIYHGPTTSDMLRPWLGVGAREHGFISFSPGRCRCRGWGAAIPNQQISV